MANTGYRCNLTIHNPDKNCDWAINHTRKSGETHNLTRGHKIFLEPVDDTNDFDVQIRLESHGVTGPKRVLFVTLKNPWINYPWASVGINQNPDKNEWHRFSQDEKIDFWVEGAKYVVQRNHDWDQSMYDNHEKPFEMWLPNVGE